MSARFILGALLSIPGLLSTNARADQCAAVTKEQAQAAERLVSVGQTIYHYCSSCEVAAIKPVLVESVLAREYVPEIESIEPYWELLINGTFQDLAYVFVSGEEGAYLNVGTLVGCANNSPERITP